LERVLRVEGKAVVMSKNRFVIREFIRRLRGRTPIKYELNVVSADEIERILSSLGFSVRCKDYFYDPPLDGLNSSLSAIVTFGEQLCSALQLSSVATYWGMVAERKLEQDRPNVQ
jgi:hypothetical protein